MAKQLTSCEDICWTTRPPLMEPSMRGTSSRPFYSLFFSLWPCLNYGADIKSQLRFGASKTYLAIAQLLQYNCYASYKEGAETHIHSKDRYTPFPVYMGMSVYTNTRKSKLVDRVLDMSAHLGDATVSKYVEDGVVVAPVLRKGLFTTSAMDNIDHNPTATRMWGETQGEAGKTS